MQCKDLAELLSRHVLSELTPEQQKAVSAHVAACEACRAKWGIDQQSQALHEAARPLLGDKDVKDAVLAEIREREARAAAAPAEPKRLGGFEILGRLGKGGMGTVLKARQVSMGRPVALKILPKKLAQNEGFVQRFLREARAAAALHHTNIVQAYDVGLVEGYYYFAMEYVEGEGLDAVLLREGPLEPNRALALMKQATSALAHAHEKGIVHRDIKPSNLMLDSGGNVRVTDFGLAKHVEGDIAVTADGQVLGTPAYVSPEMAKGKGAGPGSDLYSLGATFFHLLAGRPPFEGQNFSEVLIKQVNEAPPPLARLAPRVDRRLCHIIDRLLRKSPQGRFPSAQALLEALDGLGELVSPTEAATRTLSDTERLRHEEALASPRRRSARKRRATALVTLAACGLVVLAIGLASRTFRRAPREQSAAVESRPSTALSAEPAAATREDARESNASVLLREARKAEVASQWSSVLASVGRLEKEFADTRFAAGNREAIAELRAKAEAKVGAAALPPKEAPKRAAEPTPQPKVKVQPAAAVSFTAPSESKGLEAVSVGDGRFTTAEHEGRPALHQAQNDGSQLYLYFRAADDFARLFQDDTGRTALVTVSLLDTGRQRPAGIGAVGIAYDSHTLDPDEPDKIAIWRTTPPQQLEGTGQWTQVEFELPAARFGHRQNGRADFRLARNSRDFPLVVHSVTVSAIEEDRPPGVPAQLEKGLAAAFYAGQNHERFVVAQRAAWVNLDWGYRAPAPNVPEDGFSTRIVGWLYIREGGEHTFRFMRDDGARLYLDAEKIIDQWGEFTPNPEPVSVQLRAGWHRIWVEHMDTRAAAHVKLYWRQGDREAVVPHTLFYCEREMLERIRRDPTQDPFVGLTPPTAARTPDQRVEAAPEAKQTPAEAALAAYAKESDKVWGFFKERKYAEADKLLADLAAKPELKLAARHLQADEEAARLLKAFWAAVEKGLQGMKGQEVTLGELRGPLVGVRDGVARVNVGAAEAGQPVRKLPAADALAFAGLKGDAHSQLLRGVFLLAEGADGDAVAKALATAEAAQGLPFYKARLDRLAGAAEAAAGADLDKALALAKAKLDGGAYREAKEALARAARLKPDDPRPRQLLDDAFAGLIEKAVASGQAADFPKVKALLDGADDLKPKDPNVAALGKWLRTVSKPIFVDDFSGGRGNWEREQGEWRTSDGALAISSGEKGLTFIKGLRIDDFILEFDMKNLGQTGGFRSGVVFRDAPGRSLFFIASVRHNHFLVGGLTGPYESTAEGAAGVTHSYTRGNWGYPLKEGVTYHITVRCVGKDLEYSINGEPVVRGADEKPGRGRIGFFARAADARFDNVRLYRVVPLPELDVKPRGAARPSNTAGQPEVATEPQPPHERPKPGEWESLFDGKTLDRWSRRLNKDGALDVEDGQIRMRPSLVLGPRAERNTGLAYTGDVPRDDYEVAYDAMRVAGAYDFASLAFPVGEGECMLKVGSDRDGRRINLVGTDGDPVKLEKNEFKMTFETGRWYRVRLRVAGGRIQAWIDEKQAIDFERAEHRFVGTSESRELMPLGLLCHATHAAFRNIRLRRLDTQPGQDADARQVEGERINAAELAIPAQAEWYHTGLLVTKGQRYEVTASGRWGGSAAMSCGPAGRPNDGGGRLVGRVGVEPRELVIGESSSFVPQTTGMLRLGFWDKHRNHVNNWGTLAVTVRGPLLADKSAPLLSRFSKALARGHVNAQKDWASCGVDVERGDRILITATGAWSCAGQRTDANGSDGVINDHRPGALLGRIGEEGAPFMVGALHMFEALETGKLYLRMNAVGLAGNSGSVEVAIRSMPKP